jgi:hypothetical protein
VLEVVDQDAALRLGGYYIHGVSLRTISVKETSNILLLWGSGIFDCMAVMIRGDSHSPIGHIPQKGQNLWPSLYVLLKSRLNFVHSLNKAVT